MNMINEFVNKYEREIRYQWLAEMQSPIEEDKRLMRRQNDEYFLRLEKELEVRYGA